MKKNYDELLTTTARLEKRITALEEENIQLRKENKDLAPTGTQFINIRDINTA